VVNTADIWKFPGGISDWLFKGHDQMRVLKSIEGTTPYGAVQTKFQNECDARNIQAPTSLVSIRKIIKGYEKIGLIEIHPALRITEFGNRFIDASTEGERRTILRKSLIGISFWNPLETRMNKDFDINPFKAVLYLLLKLGHLSKLEVGNVVIFIKNQDELEEAITRIREKRGSGEEFPPWLKPDGKTISDVNNPVQHMFSLYSSTDYVTRDRSGNLILVPDKIEEIKSLFSTEEVVHEEMIRPTTERASYTATTIEEIEIAETPSRSIPIVYTKNVKSLERANNAHNTLVNIMIRVLREHGFEKDSIKRTNYIDLFAVKGASLLLCEMKSIGPLNEVSQIRKEVSQLLEYEYFDLFQERQRHDVLKFLILERKPSMREYIDFLRYCGISVLWSNDDSFEGDEESLKKFNEFIS